MTDMIKPTVRLTIGRELDRLQMNTKEFSIKAQISYQTAINLRRGVTQYIDRDTLARVCKALDVQICDVMELSEEEDNRPA